MRSVTFGQALLAVGLFGLTLATALGAVSVPQIVGARSGFADSGGGPSTTAAILLQAAAFAIPSIVLAAASLQRQENRSNPLTFSQLLTATGLLGLVIATTQAPQVAVHVAEFVWQGNGPGYWAPLLLQVVAFMVPLAVIGAARLRALRVRQGVEEGDDAITFPRLVRCLALLGLLVAAASAPAAVNGIVRTLEIEEGASLATAADAFVALGAGVVVLGTVLALLFDRGNRLVGMPASPRLLAVAGLLVLGVAAASYQSNALLLVSALAVILGLFWLSAVHAGSEDSEHRPLHSGWLLGAVAVAGLALVSTNTLQPISAIAGDVGAGASVAALVLLLAAYAMNVTLLAAAIRKLRENDGGETEPWGERKPIAFVMFPEVLRAIGVLGLSLALASAAIATFILWGVAAASVRSAVVPVLLVILSLAIALGLTLVRVRPGSLASNQGLTFSELLIATGLLGLVIVSNAASRTANVSALLGWLEVHPSGLGMIIVQVAVFVIPLAIVASGYIRRKRAKGSSGELEDLISGPRLLTCLGLLMLTLAVAGAPFAANGIALTVYWGDNLSTHAAGLVVLGVGVVSLLATLVVTARRSILKVGRPASVHLLVPAALFAFSLVAGAYGLGSPLPVVVLVAFAILFLCWLNSTGAGQGERNPVNSAWLRVVAPLAGLVFIVAFTQGVLPTLASSPEDGSSIGVMAILALAYAINLAILVQGARKLRPGPGAEQPPNPLEGEPPQTPA